MGIVRNRIVEYAGFFPCLGMSVLYNPEIAGLTLFVRGVI